MMTRCHWDNAQNSIAIAKYILETEGYIIILTGVSRNLGKCDILFHKEKNSIANWIFSLLILYINKHKKSSIHVIFSWWH